MLKLGYILMPFTLQEIKLDPSLLTYEINWGGIELILRPLTTKDSGTLAMFLENLSEKTKRNYVLSSYGKETANEFCESIAKYDKLRFILLHNEVIVALFEYSMDIPSTDIERLNNYGLIFNKNDICRFGPCVSDDYQGKGLAPTVFPSLCDIALKMGKTRLLLWGGVFSDNTKAIKYYLKMGFKEMGEFKNQDEKLCKDMILDLPI